MQQDAADETPPTVEQEPAQLSDTLFGERRHLAQRFAADLVERSASLGLLGPSEYPRIWTRHLLNSALIASLVHGRVADVGSGAGLPGIPLAIARPDVSFTLIDSMARRVRWLQEERAALGLDNVTVVEARAEELIPEVPFDVVTARAVAGLSKLVPWTAPLARRPGGQLVLFKGRSAAEEVERAVKSIRKHRLVDVEVLELGSDLGTERTFVVRATRGS